MNYKITYGKSVHNSKEIQAVLKTLKTSTAMGKNVKEFEKKIAKLFKKKYCIMVNSGSSALMLLSEILNLKKGDEFLTPVVTFPSTIVPFIKKGLIPKFIDVNLTDLQIDIDKLKKNVSDKTKAIIVPNLIGNIPDWKKIKKIIGNKRILLIEDSADTLGYKINSKPNGIADFAITSFYGSHVINCAGTGGALMLNNKKLFLKSKILRSWGRLSSVLNEDLKSRFNCKINGIEYDKKFIFSEMGFNIEPSEIGASFGLVQLSKLKENIKARQKNFMLHYNFFKNFKKLFYLPEVNKNYSTGLLAFPLIIKEETGISRKDLQIFLEKKGIQTRPIFTGNILYHPGFKNFKYRVSEKFFRNAHIITKNGLLIGLHQGLKLQDIKYIHDKFLSFFKKKNFLSEKKN
jgi:CDP-6-deoxy-D-xylo-4-hexulose-3-dehydrase